MGDHVCLFSSVSSLHRTNRTPLSQPSSWSYFAMLPPANLILMGSIVSDSSRWWASQISCQDWSQNEVAPWIQLHFNPQERVFQLFPFYGSWHSLYYIYMWLCLISHTSLWAKDWYLFFLSSTYLVHQCTQYILSVEYIIHTYIYRSVYLPSNW